MLAPSPALALTGGGLPGGCHGSEVFVNYGSPDSYGWVWDGSGPHLAVYYEFPYTSYGSYDLCWVSFHGTMNTDAYSGGSDSWDAELSGGELMILVPKTLWSTYRLKGYSTSSFVSMFYLYTYWEK